MYEQPTNTLSSQRCPRSTPSGIERGKGSYPSRMRTDLNSHPMMQKGITHFSFSPRIASDAFGS